MTSTQPPFTASNGAEHLQVNEEKTAREACPTLPTQQGQPDTSQ